MSVLSLSLWTFIIIAPLTYAAFIILTKYRQFRRRVNFLNKLPGPPPPNWLLGHVAEFPGPTEEGLIWMREQSTRVPEGIAKTWFGPVNASISVYNADTVKAILKTSEPKPRGIGGYFMVEPWLGDGLLLSRGSKWARNRRLLTPAFHFDILRPYMDVNNRCAHFMWRSHDYDSRPTYNSPDKLQKFSDNDEFFEVTNHVSQLTLDVILRCAFSYENDCQLRGETHPFVTAITELAEIATYRLLHPYLYPDIIFNLSKRGRVFKRNCQYVHQVSDEIIQKRKQTLLQNGEQLISRKGRYLDFLDVLLTAKDDSGQGLTDQEIRDEVDTFLFEGHDTTASGISWTLYALAANPEHQKLCQQEIDEVLADKDNRNIEWDDLPKLKHLTMCLKEALRMHTPVPFIERETTQDLTVEGHFIPAGSLVDVHLYVLHHNSLVWNEPEEFKPERFSDEGSQDISHFAFVPFSAGPRNCIGQHFAMHEMKTVIAKILSRFTLSLDPEREVKHKIVVVMKTENGMYMKAAARERANLANGAAC